VPRRLCGWWCDRRPCGGGLLCGWCGARFDQVVALVVDPQGGLVNFDGDDLTGISQPDLHALADDLGAAPARHGALHSGGPLIQ
jgi:hypothetical protein